MLNGDGRLMYECLVELHKRLRKSLLDQLKCVEERDNETAKKMKKIGVGEEIGVVERKDLSLTNKLLLNLYNKK